MLLDQVVFGGGNATAVSGFTTVYEASVQVENAAASKGKKGAKKEEAKKQSAAAAAGPGSLAPQAQNGAKKEAAKGKKNDQGGGEEAKPGEKAGAKRKKPEDERGTDASSVPKADASSAPEAEEPSAADNPWLAPAQRKAKVQEIPKKGGKAQDEGKKQQEDVAKIRKKGDAKAGAALLDTNARLGTASAGDGGGLGDEHDADAEVPVMMAEPSAAQKKLMRTAFVDADVEQEFKMEKEQVRHIGGDHVMQHVWKIVSRFILRFESKCFGQACQLF